MNTEALYVHIPFCDHICGYCQPTDFNKNHDLVNDLMDRLIQQIHTLNSSYRTIYIGGGKPTIIEAEQLERLLHALSNKLMNDYEFTVEANPNYLSKEKVLIVKKFGVNRINLGIQTSNEDLFAHSDEHYKFYDFKAAVILLRKHEFNNISIDLLYGLPNQSVNNFIQNLKSVLALNPDHISLNIFTEEAALFERKDIKPVSREDETSMYLASIELLKQSGYEHYEISNFSRTNKQSQQNLVYWNYENYDALGPGSSMKLGDIRKTWTRQLDKYIQIESFSEELKLDKDDQMFEFVMMGLRLKKGIKTKRFYQRFNQSIFSVYKNAITKSHNAGLLIVDTKQIYASEKGFLSLDDILLNFLDQ